MFPIGYFFALTPHEIGVLSVFSILSAVLCFACNVAYDEWARKRKADK